jgi:hypothetical protein
MNTMPLFARLVVTLPLALPAVASAAAPFTWQTNATTVALRRGAEVVWQFNFDNDASSKPFFHPLALPGGKVFSGYAGLSLRFAKDFTNAQVRATADTGPTSENRYRFSAAADYSGQIRGQEQGVAMLDHADNLRHPTRWYAIVNPSQSFAFLNAAWLQLQPFELPAREDLSLRYRVIVHPGRWDADRLQREQRIFSERTASNPASEP